MRRLDKGMLTSCVGDRYKNKLSKSFGDPSIINLTPQVQALFNNNAGVMYDFTLSQYLYQDSARTIPITAIGQAIGSVTDLSPNLKNASSSGGSRPVWGGTGYATFDAFDDYLQTAAIDFSATDAVTVVMSVYKPQSAAAGMILELSSSASVNNGSFWMFDGMSSGTTGNAVSFRSRGTATSTVDSPVVAPSSVVVTGNADISIDQCVERINGAQVSTGAADQGTGNYGTYALNIGARNAASLFFNGRIYRLLVIGRALTTTERNTAERWAAQPVGITIQ